MQLEGKVALVTGGGKGIGRAMALLFAQEGASLALTGRNDNIERVADEIIEQGGQAMAVLADVSDEPGVEQVVSAVIDRFGQIDILVNNAGIIGPTAPVVRVELKEWERTIAVNLTGAFLCAKHALPLMIERRSGRIINITSVAGLSAYALRSPYSVSKWGMVGLTETLAAEAGPYNITVNAIAPGPVRGARIDEVIRRRAEEMGVPVEDVERQYVDPAALKRMAEEDDIARMALFLASEAGRNITGQTIEISAGYRL